MKKRKPNQEPLPIQGVEPGAMFNLLRREQDAAIDEAAGIGQPKPGKRKARA